MRQNRTWTDPAVARREDPDFMMQGEYIGRGVGLQLVALGDGKFEGYLLDGGLPGAGWEPGRGRTLLTSDAALAQSKTLKRVERKSPTLGKKAPRGAVVLFDGRSADAWERGKVEGGFLQASDAITKQRFGGYSLHAEPTRCSQLNANERTFRRKGKAYSAAP